MSSMELRQEIGGVSRSMMQKALKSLLEQGVIERIKIIERDPVTGQAKQDTVYVKRGG